MASHEKSMVYLPSPRLRTIEFRSWHSSRLPLLFRWIIRQGKSAPCSTGSCRRKSISLTDHSGPSAALARSIKVTVGAATESAAAGIQNDGYWGMAVRPNSMYTGSFYAKTDSAGLPVTVRLVNDQTGATAGRTTVSGLTGEWKQYSFKLKTGALPASANNHFELTIARPAPVWFDLISLFPSTYHGRLNGNRIDLMNMLAAMHPKFLSLPGGDYLEATTFRIGINGRIRLALSLIAPLIRVPGAIDLPMEWGCSNFLNGART